MTAVTLGVLPGLTSSAQAATGAPGKPTNVVLTPQSKRMILTFTASPSNGSNLYGYTTSWTGGGTSGSSTCAAQAGFCAVEDLTNGVPYTFTVVANSDNGDSPASTPVTGTPRTVPGSPTNVTATAGNAQASVSFSAPDDNGGSPITGYKVTAFSRSDGRSTTKSCTPGAACSFTGLTNGYLYALSVVATNVAGDSQPSTAPDVRPSTQPGTPVITGTNAKDKQIELVVPTLPSNGGSAITGYKATYTAGDGVITGTVPCVLSAYGCLVSGLTNGTPYTFTLVATNALGDSAPSNARTATPVAAPGVPTGVAVQPGVTTASVTFSAPADNGGTTITSYTVTATSPAGGATQTKSCASSPCALTGLTTSREYAFTVIATNAAGSSAASDPVTATPAPVPAPPVLSSAVGGDKQVTLTYTPGAANGGSPVTGYVANYQPNGGASKTFACPSSPCVIDGLTNGTSYSFNMFATSATGNSNTSVSRTAIPAATPSRVLDLAAVPGDGKATLSWKAPADNGGSPITRYEYKLAGATTWTGVGTALTVTVTGLSNGTEYTFQVRADNAAVPGVDDTVKVSPAGKPRSPAISGLAPGDRQVVVSFPPAVSNGSPITGYTVSYSDGVTTGTSACSGSPCTVGGLKNGTAYTFQVVATNVVGDSAPSTAWSATPITLPQPPTGVTASAGDGQASVSWSGPSDAGGSPVTGYLVTATPVGTGDAIHQSCSASPCTVTGLTNAVAYTFTVTATNTAGSSADSNPSSPVTPGGKPARPVITTAAPGDQKIVVTFEAPDANGAPITGYTLTAAYGATSVKVDCDRSPCTIDGLVNGRSYALTLVAHNRAGDSVASAFASATPATSPGKVTALSATPKDRQALVSWAPPVDDGGSAVGYEWKLAGDTSWTDPHSIGLRLDNLTNGTPVTVLVRATNIAGAGPSDSVTVTPDVAPAPVQNLQVVNGNGQATLSWEAPADNGGTALTRYEYRPYSSTGAWTDTGTKTSALLTGLSNGTQVNYVVRAVNAAGPGDGTAVLVMPFKPVIPLNIRDLTATPDNQSVTVSWNPPNDPGGSPVARYEYQLSGASTWTDNGLRTSATIYSLANGREVTILVRAVDTDGLPGWYSYVRAIPNVAPDRVRSLTATPRDRSASIAWLPPNPNAGVGMMTYQYRVVGSGTWVDAGTYGNALVTGLTNQVQSTIEVRAINPAGAGEISSVTVTPDVAPDSVQNLSFTPGDHSALVTWDAPSDNTGSPVTRYEYRREGIDVWWDLGLKRSLNVTGLAYDPGGSTTQIAVRAVNAAGAGTPDYALVAPVRPDTVPQPVQNPTWSVDGRSATVTWDPPVDDGSSAVLRYEYKVHENPFGDYYDPSGEDGWSSVGLQQSVTVPDLTYGVRTEIYVRAVNAAGNSTSVFQTVLAPKPLVYPGGVTDLGATPGDRKVAVTWGAPYNPDVLSYYYEYRLAGTDEWNYAGLENHVTLTGLTNGTPVTVQVRTVTELGPNPPDEVTATPVAAPDKAVLSGTASDGTVTVTFDPPFDNGSKITSQTLKFFNGSTWDQSSCSSSPCQFTGLTNGTSYTFFLTATNAIGTSYSDNLTLTPRTTPGKVTALAAVPGNGSTSVSWKAPDSDGGSAVTGYEYKLADATDWTDNGTQRTATITGLTNGTSVSVLVRAVNAVGHGPENAVSTTPVKPDVAPGKVIDLGATPGNGQATVTWKAPADNGGSALTKYEYQLDGQTGWTSTGTTPSLALTGLTNGTKRTVTVRAVNAAGPGPSSTIDVTPVKPDVAPGKVIDLGATPGNGQATVTWKAPADNGGSPLTKYEYQLDGQTGWTSTGTTPSVDLTGLTNGTKRTVTVRAVNAAGPGPVTSVDVTPIAPVTPPPPADVAPGKVIDLGATPGNGTGTLTWKAPADNGGSALTKYEYQLDGQTGWTSTGTTPSVDLTGLTNGTKRTVTVRAVNAAGPGPVTSVDVTPIAPVTPPPPADVAPGKVIDLGATPGNGTGTLTWKAPADNGGSALTKYEYQLDGQTGWTSTGTTPSLALTGLTNGVKRTVTVRAVNAAGPGPVTSVDVTPIAPVTPPPPADVAPGKVIDLGATPGNGQATVTWKAPADNGGSPLTKYEYQLDGQTTWTSTGTTPSLALTGLTNGTKRTVTVRAVNAAGPGPSSTIDVTPVKPDVAPGKVIDLGATPGNGQATVTWKAPADNGGSPLTKYEYQLDGQTGWTSTGTTPSLALTGLTNGVKRTVTVRAVNAAGPGPSSTIDVTAVKPDVAPGKVIDLGATPGNGQATVTWKAPADNGGSPLTKYEYQLDGQTTWTSTGTTPSLALTGLTNGTKRTVTVRAVNAAGPGPSSTIDVTPIAPVTTASKPGAPRSVQAVVTGATAKVSWLAPASNGGSPLVDYVVTSSPSSAGCVVAATGPTSCTIDHLTPGRSYTFTVVARNTKSGVVGTGAGPGTKSCAVAVTSLATAPTGVQGVGGDRKLTVSWNPPANPGTSAIKRYEVSTDNGKTWKQVTSTSGYGRPSTTVTGLRNGTTYSVQVRAVNASGAGAASTAVRVLVGG